MANGIWSSQRQTTRGGASARAFDLAGGPAGHWRNRRFEGTLTHGRRYGEEELWENFASFIRDVAPVAEEPASGSVSIPTIGYMKALLDRAIQGAAGTRTRAQKL